MRKQSLSASHYKRTHLGEPLMAFRQLLLRFQHRSAIQLRFYSDLYSQRVPPLPRRNLQLNRRSVAYICGTIALFIGGHYVVHLEVAPETGRRRFMAVSEEEETLVGKIALEQTLQDFRGRILPFDHPITLQVRRITRRILTASNLGHLEGDRPQRQQRGWSTPAGLSAEIPQSPTMNVSKEWVVLVINDRRFINAFAAPGLVCVSTGIMSLARNEEGLAAIIGHEIGHVAMRHMAEHLSENQMFLPIATLLLFLGIGPGLLAPLTKYLYSFPHSRALETEADIVGLKLMSRACYDPGAAPRMFETLRKFEGEHIPKFLNTHPPTLERIAHLKSLTSREPRDL